MKTNRFTRASALMLSVCMLMTFATLFVTAEENVPLYAENFDGAYFLEACEASFPPSAKLVAAEDPAHGDVLQLDVKPIAKNPYYLWKDRNNKWVLENVTVNADGTVNGKANGVTVTNATVNVATLDAATKIDGTYYVVSGEYADASGGGNNVGIPVILRNPALDADAETCTALEFDLFLSADFKAAAGVSGRIRSSGGSLELFEILTGENGAIFDHHENGVNLSGEGRAIFLGEWHRVRILIDQMSGLRLVYLDGIFLALQKNSDGRAVTVPLSLSASALSFQVDRGANPAGLSGLMQIDNVSLSRTPRAAFVLCENDFEKESVGSAPANGFSSISVTGSTVEDTYGSKAWRVPVNEENVDKNPKIKHPAISYTAYESIVYESDLFIEAGTLGKLQSQLRNPTAFNGADATEAGTMGNGWVDLFTVTVEEGKQPLLASENGTDYGSAFLDFDRWNRISVVIDLIGCTKTVYLNGEYVLSLALKPGSDYRNLSILENSLIIAGKINKNQPAYTGAVYLDNVTLMAGRAPSVSPENTRVQDFSALVYHAEKGTLPTVALPSVPASATLESVNGNCVLRLPLDASCAGTPLSFRHAAFSCEDTERVMLEANYFIGEDATGVIASSLTGAELFTVDTATGRVGESSVCFNRGEWNNVKVLLDLSDGKARVYVNGVLTGGRETGLTSISLGTDAFALWQVVSVLPAADDTQLSGSILIDGLLVTAEVTESSSAFGDAFLTDEAFDAWTRDLLTMADTASVRLDAPSGLRFTASVNGEKLAHLKLLLGENALTGAGTLITPADLAEAAGGFTRDALDALPVENKYLDVSCTSPFDGSKIGLSEGIYFSGSIVSLKETNIARDFVGAAYLEITVGDTVRTVYVTSATVDSARAAASRTLSDPSVLLLSAEQISTLLAYAGE